MATRCKPVRVGRGRGQDQGRGLIDEHETPTPTPTPAPTPAQTSTSALAPTPTPTPAPTPAQTSTSALAPTPTPTPAPTLTPSSGFGDTDMRMSAEGHPSHEVSGPIYSVAGTQGSQGTAPTASCKCIRIICLVNVLLIGIFVFCIILDCYRHLTIYFSKYNLLRYHVLCNS
jgi:hypothetical protein